jgi:hypothetical protein
LFIRDGSLQGRIDTDFFAFKNLENLIYDLVGMGKTPGFVFRMPTVTGNAFDLDDKVRAVRKGNGYLARGASCESYYAHR